MKPHLIIDGYNLIFQFPELRRMLERDLESARDGLVERMISYSESNKIFSIIIFDGDRRSPNMQKQSRYLQVRFSKYPEKADPLIKKMIEKTSRDIPLMIVSSDREIMNFARLYGFKAISSQQFARTLLIKPVKDNHNPEDSDMSHDELSEWMRLFNEASRQDEDE